MVFNATFNNILVISWRSFLLVEETNMREHKIKGPKCGQCEEKKAMVVSCLLYFSVHEYRISIFYLLVYIDSTYIL
jgi:hypothetical protein